MHIIGISFRKGTAPILGTIIFVGILFTAVIPMLLYLRQADTLYEMRKHELEIMDEERTSENIIFYALPLNDPPRLSFIIENRGESPTTIERIWLNDEPEIIGESLSSMSVSEIGPIGVPEVEESYIIKLTTDRGNIFIPSSGIPTYDPNSGEWQMDSFTIFIMMTETKSQLHILVNHTHDGGSSIDPPVTYFDDDVDNNQPGYSISVPLPGEYYVKVTRWHGTPSEEELYPLSGTGLVYLGLTSPTVLIII